MEKLANPQNKTSAYMIVVLEYAFYVALFALTFERYRWASAPVAIVPVSAGSWYFGTKGGILTAFLSILTNMLLPVIFGHSLAEFFVAPGNAVGSAALLLMAIIVGRLGILIRERDKALTRLEQYEKDRRAHIDFLELLSGITARALEADKLQTTLEILTEHITKLHKADDGFFSFLDAEKETPIPTVAHGSMKDIYPYIIFKPGEPTLAAAVLQAGHPIPVADVENSPYISPNVAAIFPSRSMLGFPLIAQGRKLGALVLGYHQYHTFEKDEIMSAEITAEQVALVLSKSLLLEEERKQVKQLTALHDVAQTAIEVDNEDQLIERVTDIIGQNLFPDNFGVMLLDAEAGVLRVHSSYRFYTNEKIQAREIRIGEGITGAVAKNGMPQRIGNVRRIPEYVDVDDRTLSELCVPIKFQDRILGVINAESTRRDAFTADDERLLATLAGQLATTIQHSRKSKVEHNLVDQLAHSNALVHAIAQIMTQIERAFTVAEIIETLGNELLRIDLTCIIATHDASRDLFTIRYTSLPSDFLEIVETGLGYPLLRYSFTRQKLNQVLKSENILYPAAIPKPEDEIMILFKDAERPGVIRILGEIGVTPALEPLRLPLTLEDSLLGILWVWGSNIRKTDLPIMSIFAKQIGISLERARLFQEVQNLAITDPLTGLHNRRSLFELGKVELLRAIRLNRPFCCMLLDLDHFKQINDNYGHHVGDQVLEKFAQHCKNSVRAVDLVGRYGGEELIIIMPETELKDAVPVAERLRTSLCERPMRIPDQELHVTVSIGLAQKDEHTLQLETLVARADQAMYIAKHKGRNQVATSK